MKKIFLVAAIFLLAAACNKPADQTLSPTPTPAVSGLTEGSEFTIQGNVTEYVSGNPDTGREMHIQSDQYGALTVSLPGNIQCLGAIQENITLGSTVEVKGKYTGGMLSVCDSGDYYIKTVSATTDSPTPEPTAAGANNY